MTGTGICEAPGEMAAAEDRPEAVIAQVLKDLDPRVLSREEVFYRCPCSRERLAEALQTIGPEALGEMAAAEDPTEVVCQFCGKTYRFLPEEMKVLADLAAGVQAE